MLKRVFGLAKDTKMSVFFFGPRKTGKSTYLRSEFKDSKCYDLLKSKTYFEILNAPHMVREEIVALKESNTLVEPVIIYEIQKVPALLNEVHWLIENAGVRFVLCVSSARKIYKAGVNLLGGRAIGMSCLPLFYAEFRENDLKFDLLRAMQCGLIPAHYLHKDKSYSASRY